MLTTIGVVGLGTMGANLARNAARNGVRVALFNRTTEKTDLFMRNFGEEGDFTACHSLAELRDALPKPRVLLLMVKAGEAVDQMLGEIVPFLEGGDIVVDGGNSHYRDTERRQKALLKNGIRFVGMGISGGERGALEGPSMMPGGDREAVDALLPLLSKMAAEDGGGGRCAAYMGPAGAGHFVKTVHNGIEYGVMQLIAESYAMLRALGVSGETLAETFIRWNTGGLQSYLIEITGKVLRKKDPDTGAFLVDLIRDEAGQKGTGRWTVEATLQYGLPTPTITAAVEARGLSGFHDVRVKNNAIFPASLLPNVLNAGDYAAELRGALELATVTTYMQGFNLLAMASMAEGWSLSLAEIARIWRGGCIIRSSLLPAFQKAWAEGAPEADRFAILERFGGGRQKAWRGVCAFAMGQGIPIPAFASSLAYYDSLRSVSLPQNLIQAQRDFFGAHGFERVDKPGTFHGKWE